MKGRGVSMLKKLQEMINESQKIVFFGGAGVSTESGIPDFRSVDGLYQQRYAYPPETILSRSFFLEHPKEFFDFYREKMIYPEAIPNKAHYALAKLEALGKLKAIITQNIDGLHQAAGSKNVLELHGSVHRNYCMDCGKVYPLSYILESQGVPHCSCGHMVKPDVVLYGEFLDEELLDRSLNAIEAADMLIIGGTSLNVYPAAGIIEYYRGDKLVLINKSETPADKRANLVIHQSIGEVLEKAIDQLF